uniref:Uncharacterized protein n=1 Tax=Chromera velia CCMP2878 TaxID=1169474 RepID=A0A0G4F2M5_9ALVE|eukprot:Cvel_14674.t1-p1 / transcript=Cvel_14674.t1 / gene=Cvel_14674 / organism=Chromera_velia_CCMP2878 / gene_product=hypothetical protein / transcript_product=hypothetical protein / location=Cvel_scaffold1052:28247-28483(-) / protein_length=79 / sequence_SO=supercontig / SO=protein_coding / is_pseudo=false
MLFLRRHSFPSLPLCASHGKAEGDEQGDTSGGHGKGLADGLLERGGAKDLRICWRRELQRVRVGGSREGMGSSNLEGRT